MGSFGPRTTGLLMMLIWPVTALAHNPPQLVNPEPNYGLAFYGLSLECAQILQTLDFQGYPISDVARTDLRAAQNRTTTMPTSSEERAHALANLHQALNRLLSFEETTELCFENPSRIRLSRTPKLVLARKPAKFHLVAGVDRLVPVLVNNTSSVTLDLAWQASDAGNIHIPPGTSARVFVGVKADAGQRNANLQFVCGNQKLQVRAPLDVRPSGRVRMSILDEEGEPSAARLYAKAADGNFYWPNGAIPRLMDAGDRYCYVPSSTTLTLPVGEAEFEFVKGFEYRPQTVSVNVRAGEEVVCEINLERWIDMPAQKWYSGDGHIHMSLGGTIKMTPEEAILMLDAEDVHLGNMVVSNVWRDDVYDREHFEGATNKLSTPRYVMWWAEEFRNDHLGHMILYNLKKLTDPIYAGFAETPWPNDVPLNADIADQAIAQGGFVTGAHPKISGNEHAIDVALGKMKGIETAGYGAFWPGGTELLHALWNCGYRTVATAGTDSFLNVVQRDPLGGARCYARVEGSFSYESWVEAVTAGRTFISTAPMIFLDVNGTEPGGEVKLAKGASTTLTLTARGVSQWPLDEITIFYNGKILASAKAAGNKEEIILQGAYDLPESGWIAAQCTGPHNRHIFGGSLFKDLTQMAHTSPVWITVEGKPQPPSGSAKELLKATDDFIAAKEKDGKYANDEQRRHMREVYGRARARFAEMAERYEEYVGKPAGESQNMPK